MKRFIVTLFAIVAVLAVSSNGVESHDIITTKITWDREISRIVYDRCASCHNDGGDAFSLMTYAAARPWAVAIKEETLSRRMPPWGAIKGFGDFRNDQGLTSEQLELITAWVEGGVPEGDAKDLPKTIPNSAVPYTAESIDGGIVVSGDYTLQRPFKLDGLFPQKAPDSESLQVIAEFPDGAEEPLLWLYEYKPAYKHPFLLRFPIDLPAGTVVRGVPEGASIVLLPAPPSEP
jgi:hypothetical protein